MFVLGVDCWIELFWFVVKDLLVFMIVWLILAWIGCVVLIVFGFCLNVLLYCCSFVWFMLVVTCLFWWAACCVWMLWLLNDLRLVYVRCLFVCLLTFGCVLGWCLVVICLACALLLVLSLSCLLFSWCWLFLFKYLIVLLPIVIVQCYLFV